MWKKAARKGRYEEKAHTAKAVARDEQSEGNSWLAISKLCDQRRIIQNLVFLSSFHVSYKPDTEYQISVFRRRELDTT